MLLLCKERLVDYIVSLTGDFFEKRQYMSENAAQEIQYIFDSNRSYNATPSDLGSLSQDVFLDADFIPDDIFKDCNYHG